MKQVIKEYKITLDVEGPVFVGSGREISKKEYVFMQGNTNVGIIDMQKMFDFIRKKHLQNQFEKFLVGDPKGLLVYWLKDQNININEIKDCMKYVLECGDTSLQRGTKVQIMEHMRDPYGMPYIPGSSIKGMLRTVLLGATIQNNKDKYASNKRNIENAEARNRNTYLSKEMKNIEAAVFNTLDMEGSKFNDAVNDELSGLIVSDSEPLCNEDISLCQKYDMKPDKTSKTLNILKECIKPGTKIKFTITIDESKFKHDINYVLESIKEFTSLYYECFSKAFNVDRPKDNQLFLGGGVGFANKTVIYPLYGNEDGINRVIDIFEKTRVPREHKHYKDKQLGAAPHILKCTKYNGKMYQMGLCSITVS